jgi:Zn-dependent peptidase ImmA (M78 family)
MIFTPVCRLRQCSVAGTLDVLLGFSQLEGYASTMSSIGDRVLEVLDQASPDIRHKDVADRIGMTPDAFSRALGGHRHFASIELARLSEMTGADIHWLITGLPDPNRLVIAARHDFDHSTGRRSTPGLESDMQALNDIALAYRQAYPQAAADDQSLPQSASEVREALGPDFIRPFADRLEKRLNIGIVRITGLSTAYSFTVGGRHVIAIPARGNWFRENWDLAHELDHLIEGHHDDQLAEREADSIEAAANAFAAELLLPAETIKAIGWDSISDEELACVVWDWGVSTDALCRRIKAVTGQAPTVVVQWACGPTQRLLRRHLPPGAELDEITVRMDQAAQRRFPLSLQEAHLERIATGAIGRTTLAWMLGIDPSTLEVDTPEIAEVDANDLAAALGL